MQRLQAFRFELMPNGRQRRDMRRFAGACRFVYNQALDLQKANHEAGGKFIGYVELAKSLTAWRNSPQTPWLKQAPCHPLQHALKDLERAYRNFFAKRSGFPRFKRKGCGESLRYPDSKQFEIDQANSRIRLWRGRLWPRSKDIDATSLGEAGTRRSDCAGACLLHGTVGIPCLQAGEEVNIGQIGAQGARGYVVEFCGTAIEQLSVEARFTLCNMAVARRMKERITAG